MMHCTSRFARQARLRNNGHQSGDPELAAAAVLQVINDEHPPRHLVLGAAALEALTARRLSGRVWGCPTFKLPTQGMRVLPCPQMIGSRAVHLSHFSCIPWSLG